MVYAERMAIRHSPVVLGIDALLNCSYAENASSLGDLIFGGDKDLVPSKVIPLARLQIPHQEIHTLLFSYYLCTICTICTKIVKIVRIVRLVDSSTILYYLLTISTI